MSEPYTGSYESDSRTLFFDKSVEPTLIERCINYNKEGDEVLIKIVEDGRTTDDVLDGLGISDLEDNYLYSQYNVDANVPENLQEV
jgi:hypothetical protein